MDTTSWAVGDHLLGLMNAHEGKWVIHLVVSPPCHVIHWVASRCPSWGIIHPSPIPYPHLLGYCCCRRWRSCHHQGAHLLCKRRRSDSGANR